MSTNNHGGARLGAGRPREYETIKVPIGPMSDLEFEKFSIMDRLSDKDPIRYLDIIDVPCQTLECPNTTARGILQRVGRQWSIRPICAQCIINGGHALPQR